MHATVEAAFPPLGPLQAPPLAGVVVPHPAANAALGGCLGPLQTAALAALSGDVGVSLREALTGPLLDGLSAARELPFSRATEVAPCSDHAEPFGPAGVSPPGSACDVHG